MVKSEILPDGSKPADDLPKVDPKDFRAYNRMAEMMEYYHNNFRQTWNQLYAATAPGATLPSSRLIALSMSFIQHLTVHHDIEEMHIFPVLATRMDEFKPGSAPLEQHKGIHAGLDKLEVYMKDVKKGKIDLEREKVRGILDTFGTVLWSHLEDEVKALGAQNMSKYWKKEEIARLPM